MIIKIMDEKLAKTIKKTILKNNIKDGNTITDKEITIEIQEIDVQNLEKKLEKHKNLVLNIENKNWKYERKERHGGIQYRFTFSNGYGASVIKFWGTYGYEEDLWELAVLKDGKLHYDNSVANGDVVRYLTDKEVNKLLKQIENLK